MVGAKERSEDVASQGAVTVSSETQSPAAKAASNQWGSACSCCQGCTGMAMCVRAKSRELISRSSA